MRGGWHQVAFERDVRDDLTPIGRAGPPAMLVKRGAHIEAFADRCPHRGARLTRGGRLEGACVRCPFHGFRIGLGQRGEHPFALQALPTLVVSGLVFVRDPDDADRGFEAHMRELDMTHYIVPGFELAMGVAAPLVIENAFDAQHFVPVHDMPREPSFTCEETPEGALHAQGEFLLPPTGWRPNATGNARAPFDAFAFSPFFVSSRTGGDRPYITLTSAVPIGPRSCVIRLSMALPNRGTPPTEEECRFLLRQSKEGLLKDQVIWDGLDLDAPQNFTTNDQAVIAFRRFCAHATEKAV